jgi:iron complex outermembrane recepter protein
VTHNAARRCLRLATLAFSILALIPITTLKLDAQAATGTLAGTILDAQGGTVPNANVTATNKTTGATKTVHSDGSGAYSIDGLEPGTYTLDASGEGFSANSKSDIVVAAGQKAQVNLTIRLSAVMEEVTVNAGVDSIAAQTAPSGGFVEERSAQSLISTNYIQNFTSPIADFGEIVQIVPGTFTTSTDGVGLGQSKTYFRGFPDGDYDIDFDGIPFYDTNTPTHHSWAFFPSQWIGGVDFDRSPGTASTIGPTPFGGSIHLLSEPLTAEQDIRGSFSYGTWNTKLYDVAYNAGLFGPGHKMNMFVDWHRMTSDGYQSFNYNTRNAGSLLFQYQISPRTVLTGFSGVIRLNANTPNISSTRCMLYGANAPGVPATGSNSCLNADTASGLAPYTGAGLKFLMTAPNSSDPANWFSYQYNSYQVPTDFEYVGLKKEFGKGWYLDFKGYTYNYDNGELYSNAAPLTEVTQAAAAANPSLVPGAIVVSGKAYYNGAAIAPCDVQVSKTKNGITTVAEPCGIDKYNSYRKYGETALLTQTSQFGVFRAGMWYEWADTNRHQYPSDPLTNWTDQALPKFNETFWTNSYQPFVEYEFHVTPELNITPGGKLAYYTIDVLHHADDGSTVGPLTCPLAVPTAPCSATVTNTGSFTAWLPSLDFNYRFKPNWSAYGQGSTGSIVPPSAVYDYYQTPTAAIPNPQLKTPPKQQKSTTYQVGTVFKGQKFTLDADAYRIRFQNSYASAEDVTSGDATIGDTFYAIQPSSITKGIEFESTFVLASGLNLYLNSTAGNAYYSGSLNAGTLDAPYYQTAPSGLWVAQTPTDTEEQGLTYQKQGFDLGIFNKRVGEQRIDSGSYTDVEGASIIYHNQGIINPFSTLGGYFNYTIRNHSIFDQTKIRLSGTNLLNAHNIQSLSFANAPTPQTFVGTNGTTYTDQFNATTSISGADTPGIMAGRSFSVTVTFGFAPEGGRSH